MDEAGICGSSNIVLALLCLFRILFMQNIFDLYTSCYIPFNEISNGNVGLNYTHYLKFSQESTSIKAHHYHHISFIRTPLFSLFLHSFKLVPQKSLLLQKPRHLSHHILREMSAGCFRWLMDQKSTCLLLFRVCWVTLNAATAAIASETKR